MKLREYLDKYGMKMVYMAAMLDIERNTLTRVDKGIPVSREVADKIKTWSAGQIDVDVIAGPRSYVRNRTKKVPTYAKKVY